MRGLKWKGTTVGVAVSFCLAGLSATMLFGLEGGAQPPPQGKRVPIPAPVIDARALMGLFNEPLYMDLKDEMKQKPDDEEGWDSIEGMGLEAAEIANLVAIRQAKPPQEQWAQLSGNLQEAGVALARAAKMKDWDETMKAYERLINRCNECHETRAAGKAPKLKP